MPWSQNAGGTGTMGMGMAAGAGAETNPCGCMAGCTSRENVYSDRACCGRCHCTLRLLHGGRDASSWSAIKAASRCTYTTSTYGMWFWIPSETRSTVPKTEARSSMSWARQYASGCLAQRTGLENVTALEKTGNMGQ